MTNSLTRTTRKKVYAVLWVDDYGSLKLRKRDIAWYHKNAGPLSLAIQSDERFPWGFDVGFSSPLKNDVVQDYFSHHLHPERYTGSRIPKKVYDSLRLYYVVWSVQRPFANIVSKRTFRFAVSLVLLLAAIFLFYLFYVNSAAFITLSLAYAAVVLLLTVWYYVTLPRNWEYRFSEREFITRSILSAEVEFVKRGCTYPVVIRHGWNLPWEGSMEFYIGLGVLGDASAVPVGVDKNQTKGGREIEWHLSQPYIASLTEDYNVAWDGKNGKDMGILELPVNLGNISAYGFGAKQHELVDRVPDEGLVSCYIHPQDNFSPIKDWVRYLKRHYQVEFISAKTALEIYTKRCAPVSEVEADS